MLRDGTQKSFTIDFQLAALEANVVTPFFTMTQRIKKQIKNNPNVNPIPPMSTIMEECL